MMKVGFEEKRNRSKNVILKVIIGTIALLVISDKIGDNINIEWQMPLRIESRKVKNEPLQCPPSGVSEISHIQIPETNEETNATPTSSGGSWFGEASWYGAKPEWCLGCDSNFIMANGERLDDSKMTLAFNELPLGSMVRVTNTVTGKSEIAEVTDTGGFERLGRIADLSLALKNALGCEGLCQVFIESLATER
jgi:rare lipoprotein A (peptidoglycan hydrolase)